jgi:transcriptional regulator with GAF, ATPase, and Fis domain
MNPKLIPLTGTVSGGIYEIREAEIAIGREDANQIVIEDKSVSRRHCLLSRQGERFLLKDLQSHNGTFINDVPVIERVLEHGDCIRLGTSLLLFVLHEAEPVPASSKIQFVEGDELTKSGIRLKLGDVLHLMARDLSTLLRVSKALKSSHGLESLQQTLLELILDVIPAERGVILLTDELLSDEPLITTLDKRSGTRGPIRLSRTVIQQVSSERTAIMSNDVASNHTLGTAQSLVGAQVRSLLCVPLEFNQAVGVIYLDAYDPAIRFDQSQLQLLTAIAGIAAIALENARRFGRLEGEYTRLRQVTRAEHNMVGESPGVLNICRLIERVAPSDSTVLILGESGTGKELAAYAIHQNSQRARRPFVVVNCATLTDTLIESELFGHERGAFTGAIQQKKGKLEVADGGTVFLDEIGELAPALQSKLLRTIQFKEFTRVGGVATIKSDFRLIAATNRDLKEEVRQGTFRQDLFYRLNVVTLTMPPLKERGADVELLANYFITKYSKKCKRRVLGLSTGARACVLAYDWPGNIRELENAIERAIVLGTADTIQEEDLPESVLEASRSTPTAMKFCDLVREAKRRIIREAMEQAGGSYAKAAAQLGIHVNNLHRHMRTLGLKLPA